jgi:hypothetical protein
MGHGYVKQRVSGVHQRQPATQRYLGESRRRLLVSAWWPREHDIRMTTGREQRAQKIGRAENRRDPGLYCGVFWGTAADATAIPTHESTDVRLALATEA